MAAKRYLQAGILMVAASGALAIYLNFQGRSCLSDISGAEPSTFLPEQMDELERNCFIITNSYVYSLFGVAIGMILLVLWYRKKTCHDGKNT